MDWSSTGWGWVRVDLRADPLELKNLYGDSTYADVENELKHKLFLWYMHTSDVTPWYEDPRSGGYPFPGTGVPLPQYQHADDVGVDSTSSETVYFEDNGGSKS